MPSSNLVRWRDPAAWPSITDQVPPGYRRITDRDEADQAADDHLARLPARRAHQYRILWHAALDRGWQPNGLLLVCLADLAPALGHTSPTVPKRFGQWCRHHQLWHPTPGKLYPAPRTGAPGRRARTYLILTPTEHP